ncbi:hypothetical protein BU14_0172s0024 [Porphyra umbilicalis]|uniref:Uncharacterized protein n=1 Tax=Porphyra umbilicalis TaxID=2786 RepID=A0A1X6P7H5_PORUM|nr:hypothetical protein BU14_0172s0024 [Porphyra umbilicalis]|eukprot:OSX76842.1 hypothetical protein BU14_0172s0024 [Porphyra umbilicalis]
MLSEESHDAALGRVLEGGFAPTDFVSGGLLHGLPDPVLRVDGVGAVAIPLLDAASASLRAAAIPAAGAFGLAGPPGGAVLTIAPDRLRLSRAWDDAVQAVVATVVGPRLLVSADIPLGAVLGGLVVVEAGGVASVETAPPPAGAPVWGTLLLQLPTAARHGGGALEVEYHGAHRQYDGASVYGERGRDGGYWQPGPWQGGGARRPPAYFVAAYAACRLRPAAVTAGRQAFLRYHLVVEPPRGDGSPAPLPVPHDRAAEHSALARAAVDDWLDTDADEPVAFRLAQKYTRRELRRGALRPDDAALVAFARSLTDADGDPLLYLYVGSLRKWVRGVAGDGVHGGTMGEGGLDDSDGVDGDGGDGGQRRRRGAYHFVEDVQDQKETDVCWVTATDAPVVALPVPVDIDALVDVGHGNDWDDTPSEEDYQDDWTPVEHVYHMSVLVAWPYITGLKCAVDRGLPAAVAAVADHARRMPADRVASLVLGLLDLVPPDVRTLPLEELAALVTSVADAEAVGALLGLLTDGRGGRGARGIPSDGAAAGLAAAVAAVGWGAVGPAVLSLVSAAPDAHIGVCWHLLARLRAATAAAGGGGGGGGGAAEGMTALAEAIARRAVVAWPTVAAIPPAVARTAIGIFGLPAVEFAVGRPFATVGGGRAPAVCVAECILRLGDRVLLDHLTAALTLPGRSALLRVVLCDASVAAWAGRPAGTPAGAAVRAWAAAGLAALAPLPPPPPPPTWAMPDARLPRRITVPGLAAFLVGPTRRTTVGPFSSAANATRLARTLTGGDARTCGGRGYTVRTTERRVAGGGGWEVRVIKVDRLVGSAAVAALAHREQADRLRRLFLAPPAAGGAPPAEGGAAAAGGDGGGGGTPHPMPPPSGAPFSTAALQVQFDA